MLKATGRPYLLLAILIAALGVAVGTYLVRKDHQEHLAELRAELSRQAFHIAENLKRTIFGIELVAHRVAHAIQNNPDLSEDEFAQAVSKLIKDDTAVLSATAAPDLLVRHVFPATKATVLQGLNFRKMPLRLPAIGRAISDRGAVLDGPFHLVQGTTGFVLRHPVFIAPEPSAAEKLWGILSIAVAKDALLEWSLNDTDVALRERARFGASRPFIVGDSTVLESRPVIHATRLLGSTWEVAVSPRGGWPQSSPNARAIAALTAAATGLLIAMVLFMRRLAVKRDEANRILRTAIDSMHEGFVLYDQNDRLVMSNLRAREFLGHAALRLRPGESFEAIVREGLRTKRYADAVGREEEWLRHRLLGHAASQGVAEQELSDGRWVKITESKTPDGYSVGMQFDISQIKEAQHAAERAERKKTEFLNTVSHELRTPLTAIIGFSQLLARPGSMLPIRRLLALSDRDGVEEAEWAAGVQAALACVERHGQKISGSANHLLHMVNDILDWASIENRAVSLDLRRLGVAEIVEQVVRELEGLARRKGVRLRHRCHGTAVQADKVRLRQILYNLIGNALKFTEEGAVEVLVTETEEATVFEVRDSGCGIAPEHLESIFLQFSQVDGSDTRKHGGTGLGLAITRQLVQLHGGRIWVESEPGNGSSFFFTLPRGESGVGSANIDAA